MKNSKWKTMANTEYLKDIIWSQYLSINDFLMTDYSLKRKMDGLDLSFLNLHLPESVFWDQNLRLDELRHSKISNFPHDDKHGVLWKKLEHCLRNLIKSEEYFKDIPLTKLDGLSVSKSSGDWKNMLEFGECNYELFGTKVSSFEDSIKHSFNNKRPETVFYCFWDNKYFWMNDGGSHHASTAYYQAIKFNYTYCLKAMVTAYYIDEYIADELTDTFDMIVLKKGHANNVFCSLMVGYNKIPFQLIAFTDPFNDYEMIFLPKADKRCMMVKNTISKEDKNCISFNAFISQLVDAQKAICKSNSWLLGEQDW